MKYENLKKATYLVGEIDETKRLLKDLSTGDVDIVVFKGQSKLLTIGAWDTCEHDAALLAVKFKEEIVSHYEKRLDKLTQELEEL